MSTEVERGVYLIRFDAAARSGEPGACHNRRLHAVPLRVCLLLFIACTIVGVSSSVRSSDSSARIRGSSQETSSCCLGSGMWPDRFFGYCGWGRNQLQRELDAGVWKMAPRMT